MHCKTRGRCDDKNGAADFSLNLPSGLGAQAHVMPVHLANLIAFHLKVLPSIPDDCSDNRLEAHDLFDARIQVLHVFDSSLRNFMPIGSNDLCNITARNITAHLTDLAIENVQKPEMALYAIDQLEVVMCSQDKMSTILLSYNPGILAYVQIGGLHCWPCSCFSQALILLMQIEK